MRTSREGGGSRFGIFVSGAGKIPVEHRETGHDKTAGAAQQKARLS